MIATAPKILTTKDVASIVRACGEDSFHVESFLTSQSTSQLLPERNIKAAETIARTISKGLNKGLLGEDELGQLFDRMNAAILHPTRVDLDHWKGMSKADQEAFHLAINSAKHDLVNSSIVYTEKAEHFSRITDRALKNFPLSYVDLNSVEILGLFQKESLQAFMAESVKKVLTLRDEPDSANITPKDLAIAGISLIVRAQRLTSPDPLRTDTVSFYQACQLVELGINCLSYLGQRSQFNQGREKIEFGSDKAREVSLVRDNLTRITGCMKELGTQAHTSQEMNDYVKLFDAFNEILR